MSQGNVHGKYQLKCLLSGHTEYWADSYDREIIFANCRIADLSRSTSMEWIELVMISIVCRLSLAQSKLKEKYGSAFHGRIV